MDNNGKDTKSSVKLNRKMRMWHKYRNYCFGAAGVLVALVICVAVIRFMGRSSSDNKQQAAVPPTTAQQTTQNETQPVTQAPTVAESFQQNPQHPSLQQKLQRQHRQTAAFLRLTDLPEKQILQHRIITVMLYCSGILLSAVFRNTVS